MKNSQKGFVPLVLIIVLAVVAVGGGTYYYTQTHQQTQGSVKTSMTSAITDVNVDEDGLFYGHLSISWKSTNVEKVDIFLFNTQENTTARTLATSTDNKGTYYYEIEDIAAWRDYDGPFKVVVVSSTNPSIKSESIPLKIGRPCSPDVCDNVVDNATTTKIEVTAKADVQVQKPVSTPKKTSDIPTGYKNKKDSIRLKTAWRNKSLLMRSTDSVEQKIIGGATCWDFNNFDDAKVYRVNADGQKELVNSGKLSYLTLEEYINVDSPGIDPGDYSLLFVSIGNTFGTSFKTTITGKETSFVDTRNHVFEIHSAGYCETNL